MVWGYDYYGDSNIVNTHIKNIRQDVFEQFKYNPEEFIRKASNLINDEKATTIIDGITYNKTEDKFSNEIFTENNLTGKNIY